MDWPSACSFPVATVIEAGDFLDGDSGVGHEADEGVSWLAR
jgi:hypothetical protein